MRNSLVRRLLEQNAKPLAISANFPDKEPRAGPSAVPALLHQVEALTPRNFCLVPSIFLEEITVSNIE